MKTRSTTKFTQEHNAKFTLEAPSLLRTYLLIAFVVFLTMSGERIYAQQQAGSQGSNPGGTGNQADQNLKANARVNPSTLAMELTIPLANYPGRSGNGMPLAFQYTSKVWRNESTNIWWRPPTAGGFIQYVTDTKAIYAEKTAGGWTSSFLPPRIDWELDLFDQYGKPWNKLLTEIQIASNWTATMQAILGVNLDENPNICSAHCSWVTYIPGSCDDPIECPPTAVCNRWSFDPYCTPDPPGGGGPHPPPTPEVKTTYYVKRVRVQMGDGSTHEFRKDDKVYAYCNGSQNDGTGSTNGNPYPCEGQGDFRTGTFTSVDGSRMRLEIGETETTLYMPDGSRYFWGPRPEINDGHFATKYTDVSGNEMSFSRVVLPNNEIEQKWVDTLGRSIVDPLPQIWDEQTQVPVKEKPFQLPGLGGQPRAFSTTWMYLKPIGCEDNTDPECGEADGALVDLSQPLSYVSNQECEGNLTHLISPSLFGWREVGTRICNTFHPRFSPSGKIEVDENGNPITDPDYFNPVVLAEIKLPNGTTFEFKYNIYGEIAQIKHPSGSYEEFEYGEIPMIGADQNATYKQFNRGVTTRRVYERIGATPLVWHYEVNNNGGAVYEITITNPDGTQNKNSLHQSLRNEFGLYGFENPLSGMPFDQKTYSAPMSNGQRRLASRVLSKWTYSEPLTDGYAKAKRDTRAWRTVTIGIENNQSLAGFNESVYYSPTPNSPEDDPAYFARLNPIRDKSYDFKLLGLFTAQYGTFDEIASYFAGATPVAISETDYIFDPNYKGIGIGSLPRETRVINPGTNEVIAKSQTIYDNQLPSASSNYNYSIFTYAGIGSTLDCSTDPQQQKICWRATANSFRGHATTSRIWNKATDSWIETHKQFDQFGSVVKAKDEAGNEAQTLFASQYYFAYPAKVIAPAFDPTNTHGVNEGTNIETTYDFTTGLVLTVKDDFGQLTVNEYNDPLLRPTRVIPPSGGAITETIYDDFAAEIDGDPTSVKVRRQIDEINWADSETETDGLGRITETQNHDSQGLIVTQRRYDSVGRLEKASSPFRADSGGAASETVYWTRPDYDELSRVIRQLAPAQEGETPVVAGATQYDISTAPGYVGTVIHSTDAAGRQSRAVANSLGQLIRVDEPDHTGSVTPLPQSTPGPTPSPSPTPDDPPPPTCSIPNCLTNTEYPSYATVYRYSPQGKLIKVMQGSQFRYFLYDSFGRLIRVRQPEQEINVSLALNDPLTGNSDWTAGFFYDDGGHLIRATDANGVNIIYEYDKAGRVIRRCYTKPGVSTNAIQCSGLAGQDVSLDTPTVEFYYDGKGLDQTQSPNYAKGKVTKVASSISETRYLKFDNNGRLLETDQRTPFGNETVGQVAPQISEYKYNISGMVTEQKYPSGRIARNFAKPDGRLDKMVSNGRIYVSDLSFTASGMLSALKLGNGLWETAQFNPRMQVTQLGLGTSQAGNDIWKVNYEYGELDLNETTIDATKNTGNIAKQTISLSGLSQPFIQTFKYDSVLRLTKAKETTNGQINWLQTFGYDRYGNRTGFSQEVNGQPTQLTSLNHPSINPATNRFEPGQGYLYDSGGNLIQDAEGRSFTFNGDNKQTIVKNSAGAVIGNYFYDGEGNRVKKITNTETTIFIYSNGKMVAEYSSSISQNPTTSYLTSDHLDSPRVITDQNGVIKSRRDFMPFGEELHAGIGARSTNLSYASNSDDVRQKFTGYQKDGETGLDYAMARMYEGRHGRFTAVDSLISSGKSVNPQTYNRYVYTSNNPVLRVDRNGLDWIVESIVTSYGVSYRTPQWVDRKAQTGETPWTDLIYQSKQSGKWFALDPNGPRASSGFATQEAAKWQYGIFTDFGGAYDGAVDALFKGENATGMKVLYDLLQAKDFAYLVAYMKTGDFDNAALMFGKIAIINGVTGGLGKYFEPAITAALKGVLGRVFGKEAIIGLEKAICCFAPGTPVRTSRGLVSIERIKIGDLILSFNENTGKFEYRSVAQTFAAVKKNIVKISIEGEKNPFTTTTEHPFFVKRRVFFDGSSEIKWLTAETLTVGDKLLRPDRTWTRITQILRDVKPTLVYNLEVENNHNYFVGETGILSHNCDVIAQGVLDWSIVSKAGETRAAHVALHNVDKPGKAIHGVFFDSAQSVIEEAWTKAVQVGAGRVRSGTTDIVEVSMGRQVGWLGGTAGSEAAVPLYNVRFVFEAGTNRIITAYPF